MRKLLYVMAAGLLLSSCGNAYDADAAKEYCDCFDGAEAIKAKTADATSLDEIMALGETMADDIAASNKCILDWQEKFKGKLSEDGFGEELKKISPAAYEDAKEVGAL